ncbi:DUF6083 domain-containing protein [Streptomyces sp. NPDC058391]|uniref:DUF6083 domain-containing protein n=1 Tax=Streptomyces sp. NPDC058391 TaxID=3346476 RepID=UPI00365655D2
MSSGSEYDWRAAHREWDRGAGHVQSAHPPPPPMLDKRGQRAALQDELPLLAAPEAPPRAAPTAASPDWACCTLCSGEVLRRPTRSGAWVELDRHEVPAQLVKPRLRWMLDERGTAFPAPTAGCKVRILHSVSCTAARSRNVGEVSLLLTARPRRMFPAGPVDRWPLSPVPAVPVYAAAAENDAALRRACPKCGASAEFPCTRASGGIRIHPHSQRQRGNKAP